MSSEVTSTKSEGNSPISDKELELLDNFCTLGMIPKSSIYELIMKAVETITFLRAEVVEQSERMDELDNDANWHNGDLEDTIYDLEDEVKSLRLDLEDSGEKILELQDELNEKNSIIADLHEDLEDYATR